MIRPRPINIARLITVPAWVGGPMVLLALACTLLILSLARPTLFLGARTGAYDLLTPVVSVLTAPLQDGVNALNHISGLGTLQARNAQLEGEVVRLSGWHKQALTLENENIRLRALLNMPAPPQSRYVTGRIMADGGQVFAKTVLVDVGKGDGVEPGQLALGPEGMAGRVVEVGQRAARVLLLTDVNARVPVLIGATGLRGVVAGTNEAQAHILYVPASAAVEVATGAHIVTSGEGGLFPAGIPVGQVVRTKDNPTLHVAFYVDFDRLTHVRLITMPVTSDDSDLVPSSSSSSP